MNVKGLATESGDFPVSKVHLMPDVLRWDENSRVELNTVFGTYVKFVNEAVGYVLRDCERQENADARNLAIKLQTVPTPDLLRVVLAPDFTSRLLWRHPDRQQRVIEFLDRALHVEGVISGREAADGDAWTALGDVKVRQSGEIWRSVDIAGLPCLDLDSPTVTSDVRTGQLASGPGDDRIPFAPLSDDIRPMVIDRMTSAWQEIGATNNIVADFIAKFVQVIVLQADNTRTKFSSGSTRQCIGRVVIKNPQYASAVRLAEALVHEAIHALLYMSLFTVPWGIDNSDAYSKEARIVSPWTGSELKVSSFLQASFVWYGLLNFWSAALRLETFDGATETRSSMARARRGFVGPPLLDNLCSEGRKIVRDDVASAIETMQRRVKACFS